MSFISIIAPMESLWLTYMVNMKAILLGLGALALVGTVWAAPWNPDCPYGNTPSYNKGQGLGQAQRQMQGQNYNNVPMNNVYCPRDGSGRYHHNGRHNRW